MDPVKSYHHRKRPSWNVDYEARKAQIIELQERLTNSGHTLEEANELINLFKREGKLQTALETLRSR